MQGEYKKILENEKLNNIFISFLKFIQNSCHENLCPFKHLFRHPPQLSLIGNTSKFPEKNNQQVLFTKILNILKNRLPSMKIILIGLKTFNEVPGQFFFLEDCPCCQKR